MGSLENFQGGGWNPYAESLAQMIAAEPKGKYFVGRRYYKNEYKFWGYVRKSGEPWASAKLVMLNENNMLAPDRASGQIGSDDGAEYHLTGYFSGRLLYEPASDGFYPEFVLQRAQLVNPTPLSIFRGGASNNPYTNIIQRPQ